MKRFSRGWGLIILGIILFFPVSIILTLLLPYSIGRIFSYIVGPAVFAAGIFYLIKEKRSTKEREE